MKTFFDQQFSTSPDTFNSIRRPLMWNKCTATINLVRANYELTHTATQEAVIQHLTNFAKVGSEDELRAAIGSQMHLEDINDAIVALEIIEKRLSSTVPITNLP